MVQTVRTAMLSRNDMAPCLGSIAGAVAGDGADETTAQQPAAVEVEEPSATKIRAQFLPCPKGFQSMLPQHKELIRQALKALTTSHQAQVAAHAQVLRCFKGRKPLPQNVKEGTWLWQELLAIQSDVRAVVNSYLASHPPPAPVKGRRSPWHPQQITLFPQLQPGVVHVKITQSQLTQVSGRLAVCARVCWAARALSHASTHGVQVHNRLPSSSAQRYSPCACSPLPCR